jgi:enterochelin esterase family protein
MRARLLFVLAALATSIPGADKVAAPELVRLSKGDPGAFRETLLATLGQSEIQKGIAVVGENGSFVWAVENPKQPELYIDDEPAAKLTRLDGDLWYHAGKVTTGRSFNFYYMIDGARFGGRTDIPAFGADSYDKPGVPRGTLSEKLTHTSQIYEGMTSDYWIYVPAQYDPALPAALMVWQDGQRLVPREEPSRLQIVIDNLIHQKKIPVMIQVFTAPGTANGRPTRAAQYDAVTDKYARFLRDELLPEVYKKYNIRKDSYSRGIAGYSSGGICAFNTAWFQPDQFSRVIAQIPSFVSIGWTPGRTNEGGNMYPFKVRREAKRNIRVYVQDGIYDGEQQWGSWPLQAIQFANGLKLKGYDFKLSYGTGTHNDNDGRAKVPEQMTWLWRDYDPAKTEQIYEMDPEEKAKPLFRVKIFNRDF